MSTRRRQRGHLGQVVALADILANGVVILMMLIVLSIKIQSDRAQEEINQNADITTILSRDMAKSIIFNDLPSSPPAVLHDYNSCVIAHDCNESLYPILEVYDDYVRMKNENVRVTLRELLARPNPMDNWLRAFGADEKHNLRMDIYGVGAYYLALSILSENGVRHPRHWHFLIEQGGGNDQEGLGSEEFIAKYEDSRSLGENLRDGGGGQQGQSAPDEGGQEEDGQLPFSPEMLNDLTMIQGGSFSALSSSGLLPNQDKSAREGRGEGMGESEIKSRLREGRFSSIGIKLPNMDMPELVGEEGKDAAATQRELMLFIALFYLHYGHELEGFQVPYLQETLQAMLERPRHIRRNSNFAYVPALSEQLDEILAENKDWPESFTSASVSGIAEVGLLGNSARFVNDFVYQSMENKPARTERLSLLLRPWPSAYMGERAEITDSIVIAHPRHIEEDSDGLRWLPLAFLTPVGDSLNINLGFVHARVLGEEIFIPGEFNQIWSASGALRPVRTDAEVQPSILRLFYVYSPIAILFASALMWWFVRTWRRRLRAVSV